MRKTIKMFLSTLCIMVCLGLFSLDSHAATGIQNIVLRAYQQVNITWSPLYTVAGFKDSSGKLTGTFYAGTVYHGIPYGQLVGSGKYVPHGASFETFLNAVNTPNSEFYTLRGKNGSRTSTYYGSDCSAFVSYAYGLPRMITSTIAKSKLFTKVTGNSIYNAQVGDCLNKSGSHCMLITGMTYNSAGVLTNVEISEQTPPIARTISYTVADIAKKIKDKGYTILRYNNRDLVPAPLAITGTVVPRPNLVQSIAITGPSNQIAVGKSVALTATVAPGNASNKKLTWKSSNPAFVTVNSKGVIKVKKAGIGKVTVITATSNDGSGVAATYTVTGVSGIVKSISVSGPKTMNAGAVKKLKFSVKGTAGANKNLTWVSSNSKYMRASNGWVAALAAGKGKTVKITAKATDGSGVKKTIKIKIK